GARTQDDYGNPAKPAFWQAIFAPPSTCSRIPRQGFGTQPRTAEASETLLGTTSGGYDIFYGLVWGTRTAFRIGIIVVGISLLVGPVLGSLSGSVRAAFDKVVMRFTDVVSSAPNQVSPLVLLMGPAQAAD